MDFVREAGLPVGPSLCLDPAWDVCYPGGQAVRDAVGGYQFAVGFETTPGTGDIEFVGVPGRRSRDDYFRCEASYLYGLDAHPAWLDDIHKDNAIFTIAAWVWVGNTGSTQDIMGTTWDGASTTGFRFGFASSNNLQLIVRNSGSNAFSGSSASGGALVGEWAMYFLRFVEGTNRIFGRGSASGWSSASSGTSTYSTPATGTAAGTLAIGSDGADLSTGSRLGPVWMWGGTALTEAQLQALFEASKVRYLN